MVGACEGNRTLVISLEGCCSTIELHPRREQSSDVVDQVVRLSETDLCFSRGMVGEVVITLLRRCNGLRQGAGVSGPLIRNGYFRRCPHLLGADALTCAAMRPARTSDSGGWAWAGQQCVPLEPRIQGVGLGRFASHGVRLQVCKTARVLQIEQLNFGR